MSGPRSQLRIDCLAWSDIHKGFGVMSKRTLEGVTSNSFLQGRGSRNPILETGEAGLRYSHGCIKCSGRTVNVFQWYRGTGEVGLVRHCQNIKTKNYE